MSNTKLPEVIEEPQTTDIIGRDAQVLQTYIEAGLPNIATIDESKAAQIFDLYLNGKTYTQISNITRVPKGIILYLSQKLEWFHKRQEYVDELKANIKHRVMEVRLMSQDMLIQMAQMFHKKFGTKMNRYMLTGNEDFTKEINLKEIDRYLKIMELLQKSIEAPQPKSPMVNVNIGEGATLTKRSDNTIEVTAKQKAVGEMLKQYADMRREEKK